MRKKTAFKGLITAVMMLVAVCACSFTSFANGTGKIAVDSAKIREAADQSSTVVGSATKGNTVTIIEETKDASGTSWYKVMVDASKSGYVRADLITVTDAAGIGQDTGEAADTAETTENEDGTQVLTGESPAETQMDAQYATIQVEAAKMRSGPSTSDNVVESITKGTEIVVTGQSNGSDGKVWYYATISASGKAGFVRSDLVTLGDMVPLPEPEVEEEEPVEDTTQEEPEQTISNDYEAVYTTDDAGTYTWYLYDNVEGTRQKIEDVLTAAHAQNEKANANAKKVVTQRIVIIVLAVLLAIAIVTIAVLIFRLNDVEYEDEYEDDEYEEEPRALRRRQPEEEMPKKRRVTEEEMSVRRRQVMDEQAPRPRRQEENRQPVSGKTQVSGTRSEQMRPQQAARPQQTGTRPQQAGARPQQAGMRAQQTGVRPQQAGARAMQDARNTGRRPQEVGYEEGNKAPVKEAPKRRAKNFLDDDEFQFDYLNMNDKND